MKQIPGYPNYYASRSGHIYKRLKPQVKRKSGRAYISTSLNSKKGILAISRAIAITFIPNPQPEINNCVLHKDDNPLNNHVSNLKWGTQQENIAEAKLRKRMGVKNGMSKLTEKQVLKLRKLFSQGHTIESLRVKFNLTYMHTYNIVRRRAWKHI